MAMAMALCMDGSFYEWKLDTMLEQSASLHSLIRD